MTASTPGEPADDIGETIRSPRSREQAPPVVVDADDTVRSAGSARDPLVDADDTVRSARPARDRSVDADDTVRSARPADTDERVPAPRDPRAGSPEASARVPSPAGRVAASGRPDDAIYRPRPADAQPVTRTSSPPPHAPPGGDAVATDRPRSRVRWALIALGGTIAVILLTGAALVLLLSVP